MDKLSSGMKRLTTQVQVNYQHNQHKELATAIYEEKNVVDSIKKITAAKIAAASAMHKWVGNESNQVLRNFFLAIAEVDNHSVQINKDYSHQYERYRRQYKAILQAEEIIDQLQKKLDQKQTEVSKLVRKVTQKKGKSQYGQELDEAKEEVTAIKRELQSTKLTHEAFKTRKVCEAMRILTKANEILSMKNLATNQAKREISQLYFGTHHEEADLEILQEKSTAIVNHLHEQLQSTTSEVPSNTYSHKTGIPVITVNPTPQSDRPPTLYDRPPETLSRPQQPLPYDISPHSISDGSKRRLPCDARLDTQLSNNSTNLERTPSRTSTGSDSRSNMPLPLPPVSQTDETLNTTENVYLNDDLYEQYDNMNREDKQLVTSQISNTSLPPYPGTPEEPAEEYLELKDTPQYVDTNSDIKHEPEDTYLDMSGSLNAEKVAL